MHVADNLPEVLQYLDLIRDSCTALGVQMIPNNVVKYGIGINL
jgi:type III secretory pathway component EscR